MDAFSYLSVLLSIILGLAITQVFQGYRGLLLSRRAVKLYAPTLIWSALILLFATQMWWASFGLATHHDWTFATFTIILVQMGLLYMAAAVVLPDFGNGAPVDLESHYFRERRPFFLLLVAMLAASIAKDLMLDGKLPEAENFAFHLLFIGGAIISLLTSNRWYHQIQAPTIAVLTVAYIAQLFAVLT